MLSLILIALFDSWSLDYRVQFSYAEPRNEAIKDFISNIVKFSPENYEWNYIYLNMLETESKDSLIGVEYFKVDDFYSAKPLNDNDYRFYTISGRDTIFIQGNLALLFFAPKSNHPTLNYYVDGSNVGVEFLPSRLFHFSLWKFEEKHQ